ncbi:hypothetical protein AAG570_002038 [Ranatra chinensis]|uniref:Uncharacterized protein n=1 Tax=Ranatra chinensis TaxID=642074 RepID=A0ABD0YWR7_9HEMI
MASKRRNMFHKNKTQETTEKVTQVEDGGQAPKHVLGEQEAGGDGNSAAVPPRVPLKKANSRLGSKNPEQEKTYQVPTGFRNRVTGNKGAVLKALGCQGWVEESSGVVSSDPEEGIVLSTKDALIRMAHRDLSSVEGHQVSFGVSIAEPPPTSRPHLRKHKGRSAEVVIRKGPVSVVSCSEFVGPNRFRVIAILSGAVWVHVTTLDYDPDGTCKDEDGHVYLESLMWAKKAALYCSGDLTGGLVHFTQLPASIDLKNKHTLERSNLRKCPPTSMLTHTLPERCDSLKLIGLCSKEAPEAQKNHMRDKGIESNAIPLIDAVKKGISESKVLWRYLADKSWT